MKYTKSQEKHYLKKHQIWELRKEFRHDKTRQGRFEKSFDHYDWHDEGAEQSNIANISAQKILSESSRFYRSPADKVQLKLDFEFFKPQVAKLGNKAKIVFFAISCGLSWRHIAMPKQTWYVTLKKLENFFGREP